MASSTITLTGWLAKDPETRYTNTGQAVTTLTIPENHQRYNRDTRQYENYDPPQTTWREITIWGPEAEWYAAQLRKGDEVQITGSEKLEVQTGQGGTKYPKLKIHPRTIAKILRPPKQQNTNHTAPPAQNAYTARNTGGTWAQPPGAPQENPAPQDNWGAQSGGNYQWGDQAEEPPF